MGDLDQANSLVMASAKDALVIVFAVALATVVASPLPSEYLDPMDVVDGINHMEDRMAQQSDDNEDEYPDDLVPSNILNQGALDSGFDESPELGFIQVPTTEMVQEGRKRRSRRSRRKHEPRLRKKARHALEEEDAEHYRKLHNAYVEHGGFGMKPHKGKIHKAHKHFPRDQCVLHCMSSHVAAYSEAPTSVVVPSAMKCEEACAKLQAKLSA